MSQSSNHEDPCASFGPDQRTAIVWFFSMIVVGMCMVYYGSHLDRWMYDTHAKVLDYTVYRQNRLAGTTIPSETADPRKGQGYGSLPLKRQP